MKNNNFHRSKCALCNSSKLSMLLKMPSSQPVDNFRKIYSNKLKENHFEMDLYLCTNCNHVQLKNVVSPKILFGDYIYESKSSLIYSTILKIMLINYLKIIISIKTQAF